MNKNIRIIAHVVECLEGFKVETWVVHLTGEMRSNWIVGPDIRRGKVAGAVCAALGADTSNVNDFEMQHIMGDIFCAVCTKKVQTPEEEQEKQDKPGKVNLCIDSKEFAQVLAQKEDV